MKKFLSLLLTAVFIAVTAISASAYVANIDRDGANYGDVNGDGSTNNKDMTALFRYLADPSYSANLTASDINGDGAVDNKDATLLFRYISNNDITVADPVVTPDPQPEPEPGPTIYSANHLYDEEAAIAGRNWAVNGWAVFNGEITKIGYKMDGGSVVWAVTSVGTGTGIINASSSKAYRDAELEQALKDGGMTGGVEWDVLRAYRIKVVIDVSSMAGTSHTIEIVAKTSDGNINAFGDDTFNTGTIPQSVTAAAANVTNSYIDEYKFTDENNLYIKGWYGANYAPTRMGFSVNGATPTYTSVTYERDTTLNEHSFSEYSYRFTANIDMSAYAAGSTYNIRIYATLNGEKKMVLINASGAYTVDVTKPTSSTTPSTPATATPTITNSLIDETTITATNLYIKGWYGGNYEPSQMGYSINGGSKIYSSVSYSRDTSLNAHSFSDYSYRFTANINVSGYAAGTSLAIRIYAKLNGTDKMVLISAASGAYTVNVTVPSGSTTPSTPSTTGDRQRIVNQAISWLGCKESDGSHKKIIDVYNNHSPLPQGYKVSYTDAWCATFVSACAIKTGLTGVVYKECGAHRQMQLFKNAGRFQGRSYTPTTGDVIFYDWGGDGHCDHVGLVVSVSGTSIKVIEGNKSDAVGYRTIAVGNSSIYGYGVPAYSS